MKKIYYGLFFLLPLLGCRSTAPNEGVETKIRIENSDRRVTYDSREGMWGAERLRSQLDTVKHVSLIIDTLAQADVYSIVKDWNLSKVYVEPGDQLSVVYGRESVDFKGSEEAVLRNNLYNKLCKIQDEYGNYRRSVLRSIESGKPCKAKEVNFEEVQKQCTDLIDAFIAAKKGVTPSFEKFLRLDHKYFVIRNQITLPSYAKKTYFPFSDEDLKLMEECSKDSKDNEACLSLHYRYVARAYMDYLRINDPQHKCKFGKDFVKNEIALSEYFPGDVVPALFAATNLTSIAYECGTDSNFVNSVKNLDSEWKELILAQCAMGQSRAAKLTQKPVEFPEFSGVDVNGKTISLKDFRGKYVLIDCWATWCGVCQGEFKYTNGMEPYFEGKDVVFLGVSVDKASDNAKWKQNIIDKELKGIQINISDDKSRADFTRQLGVTGYPHYALVGPDGRLIIQKLPKPSTGVQHLILKGYLGE